VCRFNSGNPSLDPSSLSCGATSLNGDALGEITGLVHVAAELDGEMVGEELEGDHGQDRADEIRDFRNGDDVVGDAFQLFGTIAGGDGDDRAFAGADLLDVVHVLREDGVVRCDEDRREVRPDEGDDAVF
jgi:hypothetical protein